MAVFSFQFSVFSFQFSVLSSQFSVLSSQFSVLSSQFSVLSFQFSVLSSQFSGGSVLLASGETAVEGCFVRVCFSPRKNTEEHGKSQGVGEWGAGVFNHEFHECHESKAEIFGAGGLDPGGR